MEGVTAIDTEDGNITEATIISNNVDMSQAGVYQVTYKVTDKDGALATKTITVDVNPKLEEIKLDEDKNQNYNTKSLNRLLNTGYLY